MIATRALGRSSSPSYRWHRGQLRSDYAGSRAQSDLREPSTPTLSDAHPIAADQRSEIARAIDVLRSFVQQSPMRLGAAEAAALSLLYEKYSGMVVTVCRRILASNADAEDVLHDVFLNLPRTIGRYRDGGFGGWIRQVATRTALMRLRRKTAVDARTDAIAAGDETFADHDFVLLERHSVVRAAITALPVPLREVTVLRFFLQFSHEEIAICLGISSGASEVRLCRAVKQLRQRLRTYR
jgi:RNA polymerase sigma-70 factor (ECF subfamily)